MKKIYLCISVIIMLMLIMKNNGFGQSTTSSNSLTGGTSSTPNEYLGSSNAYDVLIKSNNSERIRIDYVGLVGINATSTGARLHVAEKPDEVILLLEKQYPNPTTKDILQWKNNTVLGVIDANGRIGVGTTAPASDLHVHRTTQVGTASSYTGTLKFLNSTNANGVTFQAGVTSANTTYTFTTCRWFGKPGFAN